MFTYNKHTRYNRICTTRFAAAMVAQNLSLLFSPSFRAPRFLAKKCDKEPRFQTRFFDCNRGHQPSFQTRRRQHDNNNKPQTDLRRALNKRKETPCKMKKNDTSWSAKHCESEQRIQAGYSIPGVHQARQNKLPPLCSTPLIPNRP